jgi:hypothetical protein
MQRYWLRIALGALLVFALGMAAMTMLRRGRDHVKTMLATVAGQIPNRLANLPVRLDGRRIASVERVEVDRRDRDEIGRIRLTARLDDPALVPRLRECDLVTTDARHLAAGGSFRCAGTGDLERGPYRRFGEITFEPGALTRPVYLPERDVEDWRRTGIRRLTARFDRAADGSVRALGSYDFDSKHGRREHGTFDLQADAEGGGARFTVRDAEGRELVRFRADASGLSLSVKK